MPMKSKIIAEAATCHGGDFEEAKRLIDLAVTTGSNTIKFQLINPSELYVKKTLIGGGKFETFQPFETRSREVFSQKQWVMLGEYAKGRIEIAFTFFDVHSLSLLEHLEVPFIKIASGDINHTELLRAVNHFRLPVVLSTGMSSEEEIQIALLLLSNCEVTLLHCVSLYPCPIENAHLERIQALKKFEKPVGFSDHTMGNSASLLAHSLGSRLFEKHFRLEDSPVTADYNHSTTPKELRSYVDAIKLADSLLDLPVTQSDIDAKYDLDTKRRARRGLYFSRRLPKGSKITKDDLKFVRPLYSESQLDIFKVIGKVTATEVFEDYPVVREYLDQTQD